MNDTSNDELYRTAGECVNLMDRIDALQKEFESIRKDFNIRSGSWEDKRELEQLRSDLRESSADIAGSVRDSLAVMEKRAADSVREKVRKIYPRYTGKKESNSGDNP